MMSFSFKSHGVTEAIVIYSLLVYNMKYAKCFNSKFKCTITVNRSRQTGKMYNPRTKTQPFYQSIPHSNPRTSTITHLGE